MITIMMIFIMSIIVYSEKVLLIGDSIDRMITHQWCYSNHLKIYHWGEGTIKDGDPYVKQPSFYCRRPYDNDSLAAVHIFSSKPYGPYYLISSKNDKYVDTSIRIIKAIELYIKEYGIPNKVIFNTELWDLRPFYALPEGSNVLHRNNINYKLTLKEWKNNVQAMLKIIKHQLSSYPTVEIGIFNVL